MTQRVQEEGQVVNVVTVIAIGVNNDGKREVPGIDVFAAEDEAGRKAFLRLVGAVHEPRATGTSPTGGGQEGGNTGGTRNG